METTVSTDKRKAQILYGTRVLLALLFLVSAVAKLYPSPYFAVTTFESKQLLPMGFDANVALYFSRILIGCELALGILLLQPHYFRRLILPASFLMLLVFSVHLSFEVINGVGGNCGCFGSLLPMTPGQALIKNIVAMGLMVPVFLMTGKHYDRRNFLVVLSVTLASVLAVFMVAPMSRTSGATNLVAGSPVVVVEDEEPQIQETQTPSQHATAPSTQTTPTPGTDSGDNAAAEEIPPAKPEEPKKKKSGYASLFPDIDNGKKVLCFFAPGCDHCQQTAKELTQLKKQIAGFPDIRIVFMDEEAERIPEFFNIAGAKYTHMLMDVGQFWTIFKGDTPGVFYLWNGNVIKSWDGIEANAFKVTDFKKIVQKPWEELK